MKKKVLRYAIIAGVVIILVTAIVLIVFLNRKVIVPEVSGQEIVKATQLLTDAGFKVEPVLEYSDTVSKNVVILQDKDGGTKEKYGTKIILFVSNGKIPVTLPDVINKTASEAADALKKIEFVVVTKEAFSDTVEKGNVISQSVHAGKQAAKGSTITLTISKGPDLVTVPNIKGMTQEKAEQVLKEAGLTLETKIQFSNSVKEGRIISQDIAGNTQAKRNSVVNAKISAGIANKAGTTPSNANYFGMITTQGNWIYFAGSDDSIYRMRKDKSVIECICNSSAVSLNVVGEWLYFVDGTVGGIYKVKIDGTEKTKISDVTSYKVYVVDGWIYYTSQYWGGNLYKMKTDGSSITQISSENCREFIVNGQYIYYVNTSNNLVYKCRNNGKENTILCAGFGGSGLTLVGNKLVIANIYDIQSVNLDGSGFTSFEIDNVQHSFLNGYNGWVYYLEHHFTGNGNAVSSFGRMRPDGSQKTKIYDYKFLNHANSFLNVADSWIYFQNEHEGDALYRVKIDGSKLERMG